MPEDIRKRLEQIDWRRLDLNARLAPGWTLVGLAALVALTALLCAPVEVFFVLLLLPAAVVGATGALWLRSARRGVQRYIRALEGEGGLLWHYARLGILLPSRLQALQEASAERAALDPHLYREALAMFARQAGLRAA